MRFVGGALVHDTKVRVAEGVGAIVEHLDHDLRIIEDDVTWNGDSGTQYSNVRDLG